ncbi:MAG: hypothetical protein FVQ81_02610 [Candidatus Glassbacteria bacterium]|nr:hypothetical protein [Candidatus Glassbacteria bacterium]
MIITIRRLTQVALSVFMFAIGTAACGVEQSRPVQPSDTADQAAWRVIGPGGGGAQFLSTINPQDPDHVFVRCDMTGAYLTVDGGKSWRMFNLRTVVRDFEFDPSNPSTVYASNSGVYRSDDRGGSWRLIYPRPEDIAEELMVGDHANHGFRTKDSEVLRSIPQVLVDPEDGNNLYIGDVRQDGVRVMHSPDRGASWRRVATVEGSGVLNIFPGSWYGEPDQIVLFTTTSGWRIDTGAGSAEEIELPRQDILVADGGYTAGGAVFYVTARTSEESGKLAGGVYRSSDGGASWRQINNGLAGDWKSGMRVPGFYALAVCESAPEVAYLSCGYNPVVRADGEVERRFGVFKTTDGGESWHWVYRATSEKVLSENHEGGWMVENYGPEWGEYPLSLGVSPTDPEICWANDFGTTYRTLDGGAHWAQVYTSQMPDGSWVSRGLDVTTNYGVHFDPFDPLHVFISYTDIGAFHSFNGGESWVHSIEGAPRAWRNTCYWMVFDPELRGRAWGVWGSGHDLPRPKMFRSGRFDRYVGGVTVSDDAARTWRQSNEGMPPNTVSTHILLDPDSPAESRTLYVSGFGKGVFKSTDGGATWTLKNEGIAGNLNAWRITRTPDGRLYLLVARGLEKSQVVDGAMYTSTDGAESWQPLAMPPGVNAPNDLIYDPAEPRRMYLSCWPEPVNGVDKGGGLWRTGDGGASWKLVFREDAHVYGAALDPENPNTVIINGFDSAAFRSDDRGESWYRLEGYNFKWGHRPVFDVHNPGMIYLTTFGGSVFHGPATGVPGAFEDILEPTWQKWYGRY